MSESDKPYEFGYGKPPREMRFQKGASGNPKGRPKGAKNLATIVLKQCRQKVRINGPRRSLFVTKIEAAVMQIVNKSAQGDLKALRMLIQLLQQSEEVAANGVAGAPSESDQKVIEGLQRWIANLPSAEDGPDTAMPK